MLKRILSILILLVKVASAQPSGYTPVADVNALKDKLRTANKELNNIASDFEQTKHMALLDEEIISKGKFSFEKDFKVRIEYQSPYYYLMVMNGNKVMVKDEKKTNVINSGRSKIMQSINQVMVDCIQGTVFTNKDFDVKAYRKSDKYLLTMSPVNNSMKELFAEIDVYINAGNMNVSELVMKENGGDYTNMKFFNIKNNTSPDAELYKVN